MSKKLIIIITIIVLLITGIGYYFFSQRGIVKVVEVKPTKNKVIKSVTSSGVVKSTYDADLAFLATGKISKINVKENQIVKKNALLAVLNTSSAQESANALKNASESIQNDKKIYKEKYADDLKAAGGRENYETTLKKYDDQIQQAEASYRSQLGVLPNYYIYAPFEGTVVDVVKESGENITGGSTLIKIADLTKLYFEVNLDQEDLENLKVGQSVKITLDAYPNNPFDGKVLEMPSFAKEEGTTKQFPVKIEIMKNDKTVLLGMDGDAEITVNETSEAVNSLIFDEVFKETDKSPFVWILTSNNKLKKEYIEIGLEGDIYTEIKTPLDKFNIVMPQSTKDKLVENQKAQIVKEWNA